MITSWAQNAPTEEDGSHMSFADVLIDHFSRWITSPRSKLYDPALHTFVHNTMKKLFLLLVGELRKLGSRVIYGSFNKIVLCTTKTDLESARAYIDYILKTIKANSLFSWIDLIPTTFWDIYLFMDNANFGGVHSLSARPQSSTITSTAPASDHDPRNSNFFLSVLPFNNSTSSSQKLFPIGILASFYRNLFNDTF